MFYQSVGEVSFWFSHVIILLSVGVLEGTCEFCGKVIKPFPTPEQQKLEAPEDLYCCESYQVLLA